mmetsp:Transcript_119690/g.382008  ORF Transcript_119690/g.382008 Transcript_119690/m.382008 type:complete len:296 (+) Transcript_119690:1037-1924(+)
MNLSDLPTDRARQLQPVAAIDPILVLSTALPLLGFSVQGRALDVESLVNLVRGVEDRGHDREVVLAEAGDLDAVQAGEAHAEGSWRRLDVRLVGRKHSVEQHRFILGNRFDDELSVCREEEEFAGLRVCRHNLVFRRSFAERLQQQLWLRQPPVVEGAEKLRGPRLVLHATSIVRSRGKAVLCGRSPLLVMPQRNSRVRVQGLLELRQHLSPAQGKRGRVVDALLCSRHHLGLLVQRQSSHHGAALALTREVVSNEGTISIQDAVNGSSLLWREGKGGLQKGLEGGPRVFKPFEL